MRFHLLLAGLFLMSFSAHALPDDLGFEFKLHYGSFSAPKDANTILSSASPAWSIPAPKVMGADLLFHVPVFPLVLGVRYETFSSETGTVTYTNVDPGQPDDGDTEKAHAKLSATRIAALVGYRFVDLPVAYVGVMANVGVSQKMKYNLTVTDVTNAAYSGSCNCDGKLSTSFGAGVDAGLYLGMFEIGAEVGYLSFKAKSFTDDTGATLTFTDSANNTKDFTADFSGMYYKGFVGIHF